MKPVANTDSAKFLRSEKQISQSPQTLHTYIFYIFISPRSHVTIQDAKTVSDEIEKGAKKI